MIKQTRRHLLLVIVCLIDNVCIESMTCHITRRTLDKCHANIEKLAENISKYMNYFFSCFPDFFIMFWKAICVLFTFWRKLNGDLNTCLRVLIYKLNTFDANNRWQRLRIPWDISCFIRAKKFCLYRIKETDADRLQTEYERLVQGICIVFVCKGSCHTRPSKFQFFEY